MVDGKHVSAAGVTAGIDGALTVASLMRNERAAQQIQLSIEYAPAPPFNSGTPETAPPEVLDAARASVRQMTEARLVTARRIGLRLGIKSLFETASELANLSAFWVVSSDLPIWCAV